MNRSFEYTGGSIAGTLHRKAGKPCQDSLAVSGCGTRLVAVVSDGCGSTPNSQIGSFLGARLFVQALNRELTASRPCSAAGWSLLLEQSGAAVLQVLRMVASQAADNAEDFVRTSCFFTLVGAAMTEESTCLFSCGDGIVCCNRRPQVLPPLEGNMPVYLGYRLLPERIAPALRQKLGFTPQRIVPTEEIQSILLATDGATPFLEAPTTPLPGRKEALGPLTQFVERDCYFSNPDALRRRLAMANHDRQKAKGLLEDDTTVIAIRRRA